MRLARRGEIGEAIATEDIRCGDLVVGKAPEYHKPIEIVMRWENEYHVGVDMALPGAERTVFKTYEDGWIVLERMRKQRALRREKWNSIGAFFAMLGFIAVVILILVALTEPAKAQEGVQDTAQVVSATVTAYTSSEDETDSTPFENASGTRPARGSVACPRALAFGTQVVIEGKTYKCDDRMHHKYADRYDIWVESKAEAFEWGRRTLAVVIK